MRKIILGCCASVFFLIIQSMVIASTLEELQTNLVTLIGKNNIIFMQLTPKPIKIKLSVHFSESDMFINVFNSSGYMDSTGQMKTFDRDCDFIVPLKSIESVEVRSQIPERSILSSCDEYPLISHESDSKLHYIVLHCKNDESYFKDPSYPEYPIKQLCGDLQPTFPMIEIIIKRNSEKALMIKEILEQLISKYKE